MEKMCGCAVACVLALILGSCIKTIATSEWRAYKGRKACEERQQAADEAERQRERELARIRAEEEARILAERQAAERRAFAKEDKLRSFILKEAPVIWTTYQNLKGELVEMDKKINGLRSALKEFDRDPDADEDLQNLCRRRSEVESTLKTLKTKIEDAYLASRKYEATPGKKEYGELQRRCLEDGIQEAEAAARRFDNMRKGK